MLRPVRDRSRADEDVSPVDPGTGLRGDEFEDAIVAALEQAPALSSSQFDKLSRIFRSEKSNVPEPLAQCA